MIKEIRNLLASFKFSRDLHELTEVMRFLNSEHNLEKLLKKIVTSGIQITHSDAGSLYLKEGDFLKFIITDNRTLVKRMGRKQFEESFKPFAIPLNKKSIAGYVAVTGKALNIPDVYRIRNTEYSYNTSFDQKNNYRNKSILAVPLINKDEEIIGVLQLFNKISATGRIVSYRSYDEEIVFSLASQAAVAIENAILHDDIKEAHFDSIIQLSMANEFRDNETGYHVKRVTFYCEAIARAMGFDETFVENLKYASALHDIGKIGIPDNILKKAGRLTVEEFEVMKKHALIGARILGDSKYPILQLAKKVALSHHEKWDGTGYPNGLKEDAIDIGGRITTLADVFDALSNERVYKPAIPLDTTFEMIREGRGKHFDPDVVDAFFKIQDEIVKIYNKYKEQEKENPDPLGLTQV